MGMRNSLTFGEVNSSDYGIYISGTGVYDAPKRAVEKIAIPGRNGLLTIDQGRYDNVTIEYPAFAFGKSRKEFQEKIDAFRNAIASQVGYQRLQDTYHPDEYRMALYAEGLEVEVGAYGGAGRFTLTFECKPQRWLISGEIPMQVESGGEVINPTLHESSPLLEIEGHGTVRFNGYEIEVEDAPMGEIDLLDNVDLESGTKIYYSLGSFNSGDVLTVNDAMSSLLARTYYANQHFTGVTTVTHDSGTSDYVIRRTVENENQMRIDVLVPEKTFTFGTAETVVDEYTVTATLSTPNGTERYSVKFKVTFSNVTDSSKGRLWLRSTVTYYVPGVINLKKYVVGFMPSSATGFSTKSALGNPTYIDCDLGEAYRIDSGEVVGLNRYIDLGSDLPTLKADANEITFDNTITDLKVIPRWWQL